LEGINQSVHDIGGIFTDGRAESRNRASDWFLPSIRALEAMPSAAIRPMTVACYYSCCSSFGALVEYQNVSLCLAGISAIHAILL
jgi:hypothetical protein